MSLGKEHGLGFFVTAVANGSPAYITGLKVNWIVFISIIILYQSQTPKLESNSFKLRSIVYFFGNKVYKRKVS